MAASMPVSCCCKTGLAYSHRAVEGAYASFTSWNQLRLLANWHVQQHGTVPQAVVKSA
jgi:hypothetical protein